MASREYCSNMAEELEVWSNKLHDLSNKIDIIPSIEKYHILSQIEELHIIMTELDDRLCEMVTSCPTVGGLREEERVGPVRMNSSSGESFDYDFGG